MKTNIDDQIKTLINNPESYENPSKKLGTLCGKRAVANCPKDPQFIRVWVPSNIDWEALKTLLGEDSDTACLNFHEADTAQFIEAFSNGALAAVDGKKKVRQACDELDQIF